MNERFDVPPHPHEHYSPQRRTALVLTGTGTAGAYHAGVLRALHEAGVKLDVVAGHGIGVVGALFAAIDGAPQLWDEKGFWRSAAVGSLYHWHLVPRIVVGAMGLAVAVVAMPLVGVALGSIVFPLDFVAKMVGLGGSVGLTGPYVRAAERALAPGALPTWLPRLAVLVLGAAGLLAGAWGVLAMRARDRRGRSWWRVVRAPLSSTDVAEHCWRVLWNSFKGATPVRSPTAVDLGRRYTELLADNLGQPGFRELLIVVHDLDARKDLVFALVSEVRRRTILRRPTTEETEVRRAEVFDLAGTGREYLAAAVAAAVTVPVASEPHAITFAPDAYWRGETHRTCDRPASLGRVLEELANLEVEQIVIVSAAPDATGPHALGAPRHDPKGRIGEYLQSSESAILRDVMTATSGGAQQIFVIRPAHNALGPFDVRGGFDARSDRAQPLDELLSRGYEDAYRQFIEPVVGASGDRVGQERP